MLVKFILSVVFLCLIGMKPLSVHSQARGGFEITGQLDGLENGMVVKLCNRFADWHTVTWMDSCIVTGGKFHFNGPYIPEEPRRYQIYFFKGGDMLPHEPSISFFIKNGENITVGGDIRHIRDAKIYGSRGTEAQEWRDALFSAALSRGNIIESRLPKITDSIGYERGLIKQQLQEKENLIRWLDSSVKHAPAGFDVVVPDLIVYLHFNGFYHGSFEKLLFDGLSSLAQNSYDGKSAGRLAALSVGQYLPSFTLADPDGRKIALKDILPKGRMTLVHFWARGSAGREIYQDELRVMYHKFHDKGLEVVGVSADTSRMDWEGMVRQQQYPWVNVIAEPRGWAEGSLVYDMYGEGGHRIANTTNVLLDNKGRILAFDVEGPVLHYFLEKYLD